LLNGSELFATITPHTCPSGCTTAYPPVPLYGADDGVVVLVSTDGVVVLVSTVGVVVDVSTEGVVVDVSTPEGKLPTGFAQTPPLEVEIPFA
jgi:hypothetical protein